MTNEELLNVLKSVRGLFANTSPFYIRKFGAPITNADQSRIDAVFIAVDAAIASEGVSASPQPDKEMLEAIAEDGLLVTWDKDFKFNFSQVVRLMAEFVIEHPWADAAQEQPVENCRSVTGAINGCGCVCHAVGLFGLMCCPCTKKDLDELVNGKRGIPVAPSPQKGKP